MQDPSSVGNAMKTISMRIRAASTELEEAGLDTEGMATSVADLRQEILALSGVDIMIDDSTFKSTYDILDELSNKWSELTDIQQSSITELIAGKRQGNVMSALMSNFDIARESVESALNSDGSAEKELSRYQESIQYSIDSFQAAFQELSSTVISSDFLKGIVDGGTTALEVINSLVESFGSLNTIVVGIGSAKIISSIVTSISDLKKAGSSLTIGNVLSATFSNAAYGIEVFKDGLASSTSVINVAKSAISGLWTVISAHPIASLITVLTTGITIWKSWDNAQKEALQTAKDNANSYGETQDDIQSQIDKIKELRETISDSASSEQEVYNAKSDLLAIQQQLVESYGNEVDGINLVNGSLEDQIGLLQDLSVEQANRFINENYDQIAKAEKEMTKILGGDGKWFAEGEALGIFTDDQSEEIEKIKEIVDKYKDYLKLDDLQDGTYSIRFVGNAEDAESVLNDVMTDIRNAKDEIGDGNYLDYLFDSADSVLSDANEILDTYQTIYEQSQKAKLIADPTEYTYGDKNETASEWLNDYSKAIEDYNEALASGDTSQIDEAKSKYEDLNESVQYLLANSDFSNYADDINTISSSLDTATISANSFKDAINGVDITDQNKAINDFANTIKDADITDIDFQVGIENPSDETALGAAISGISFEAEQAGISVEDLISILEDFGIISNGISEDVESSISGSLQDFYDLMNNSDDGSFSDTLDGYKDKLDTLKETLDNLKSGDLTDEDLFELALGDFPELSGFTTETEGLQEALENLFNTVMTGSDLDVASFLSIGDIDENTVSAYESIVSAANEVGLSVSDAFNEIGRIAEYGLNTEAFGQDLVDAYYQISDAAKLAGVSTEDMISAISANSSVLSAFDDAIEEVGGQSTEAGQKLISLRDQFISLYDTVDGGFSFDITAEIGNVDNLKSAISESVSGTGLTEDSVNSIKAMYGGLDSYDPTTLFERTENGIHLNEEALKSLESEYESVKKQDFADQLADLSKEYIETKSKVDELTEANKDLTQAEIDEQLASEGMRTTSAILEDIQNVETLQSQYEGLTSAFNKWQNAQSQGNERDSFQSVAEGYEDMQEILNQGWYGDESLNAYLDLLISASERTDDALTDFEKLGKTIEGTNHSLKDYFTFDDDDNLVTDGLFDFLDDVKAVFGETYAWQDENGKYNFDFDDGRLEEIAERFGTTTEMIQLMERAMIDAGMGVDLGLTSLTGYNEVLETTAKNASTAQEKLKELQESGDISASIDLDFDSSEMTIDEITGKISELKNEKATINIDTESGQDALSAIDEQIDALKQQEILLYIQTTVHENGYTIEDLKAMDDETLQTTLNVDTSDVEEAKEMLDELGASTEDTTVTVKIDETQFEALSDVNKQITVDVGDSVEQVTTLTDAIDKVLDKTVKVEAEVIGTDLTNNLTEAIDDVYSKTVKVIARVIGKDAVNALKVAIDRVQSKTVTVTSRSVTTQSDGTAHAQGTIPAHASGTDISIKHPQEAVVNEIQEEGLIRDGVLTRIRGGMQKIKLKAGDIILNHKQMKELDENGYVTSNGGHGKLIGSFMNGTVNKLPAYDSGSGGSRRPGSTTVSVGSVSGSGSNSSSSSSSSSDEATETALEKFQEWFSKLFDWIEIKLERQTTKVSRYISRAESALEDEKYTKSAKNYRKAISATATQVGYEEQASVKYSNQAAKVLSKAQSSGLITAKEASEIAKNVKNGTIALEEYSDEMQEVISSYQEFYDKSLDASNAIEDLHANIKQYISDLKSLRDAQRDAALSTSETFTSIATVGSAYTPSQKNSQLKYQNKQLEVQNEAYATASKNAQTDLTQIGNTASSSIADAIGSTSKKKYQKALEKAEKSILSQTAISDSVLSTIKSYNTSVYENLYAYNLALENLETAELEEATNYASTSSEIFDNLAEIYENKDTENENKRSLYEQYAENAKTASEANKYLKKAANTYDTLVSNDLKEIDMYQSYLDKSSAEISSVNKGITSKINEVSTSKQEKVSKYINSAQESVNAGKAISANTIAKLAEYNSDGLVTDSFYQACIDWNNALAKKEQAEAQLEIDEQTAITEKESLALQQFENTTGEYEEKLSANESATSLIQAQQNSKTASGQSLDTDDYNTLIKQSKERQEIATNELNELQKQMEQGLYEEGTEAYKAAEKEIKQLQIEIQNCTTDQIEYNNAIANLPYETIEKALDLLEAIGDYEESVLNLKESKGETLSASDYAEQISNLNAQIEKATEEVEQTWSDYQNALNNGGTYGEKTANEWLTEWYEAKKNVNDLNTELQELSNTTAQLPYDTIDNTLELLESIGNYEDSVINLKEANGETLQAIDYLNQIQNLNEQIAELSSKIANAWSDYQNALNNGGTYGGKTADAWLAYYYDLNTESNNLQISLTEINNTLANLELDSLEDMVELLESAVSYIKSFKSIADARGQVLGEGYYREVISTLEDQISRYQEQVNIAAANYSAALASADNTYGDKTSGEWLDLYYQYATAVNNATAEIEEMNAAIVNLPLDDIERFTTTQKANANWRQSWIDLADAVGKTPDVSDYNGIIAVLTDEIDQYSKAVSIYAENIEKARANGGYYAGETIDAWYAKWYDAMTTVNDLNTDIQELENTIAQMPYDEIEKVLDLLDSIKSYTTSDVDLKSKLGEDLSASDYTDQIDIITQQIEQYQKDRTQAYRDYMTALASGGYYGGKTSDEWLAEYNNYGATINNLESDIEDLRDALRDDVYWRTFERAHDACERFADVLSGVKSLISSDMYFDTDGNLTEMGVSQVANLVSEYENAREEVRNYSNDIKNLNKLYSTGWYTQEEYYEKLNELQTSVLDSASNMKSAISEIIDMYKELSQNELDALFDLIDARSEALDAKKACEQCAYLFKCGETPITLIRYNVA